MLRTCGQYIAIERHMLECSPRQTTLKQMLCWLNCALKFGTGWVPHVKHEAHRSYESICNLYIYIYIYIYICVCMYVLQVFCALTNQP